MLKGTNTKDPLTSPRGTAALKERCRAFFKQIQAQVKKAQNGIRHNTTEFVIKKHMLPKEQLAQKAQSGLTYIISYKIGGIHGPVFRPDKFAPHIKATINFTKYVNANKKAGEPESKAVLLMADALQRYNLLESNTIELGDLNNNKQLTSIAQHISTNRKENTMFGNMYAAVEEITSSEEALYNLQTKYEDIKSQADQHEKMGQAEKLGSDWKKVIHHVIFREIDEEIKETKTRHKNSPNDDLKLQQIQISTLQAKKDSLTEEIEKYIQFKTWCEMLNDESYKTMHVKVMALLFSHNYETYKEKITKTETDDNDFLTETEFHREKNASWVAIIDTAKMYINRRNSKNTTANLQKALVSIAYLIEEYSAILLEKGVFCYTQPSPLFIHGLYDSLLRKKTNTQKKHDSLHSLLSKALHLPLDKARSLASTLADQLAKVQKDILNEMFEIANKDTENASADDIFNKLSKLTRAATRKKGGREDDTKNSPSEYTYTLLQKNCITRNVFLNILDKNSKNRQQAYFWHGLQPRQTTEITDPKAILDISEGSLQAAEFKIICLEMATLIRTGSPVLNDTTPANHKVLTLADVKKQMNQETKTQSKKTRKELEEERLKKWLAKRRKEWVGIGEEELAKARRSKPKPCVISSTKNPQHLFYKTIRKGEQANKPTTKRTGIIF
jgi:hypothetical protein